MGDNRAVRLRDSPAPVGETMTFDFGTRPEPSLPPTQPAEPPTQPVESNQDTDTEVRIVRSSRRAKTVQARLVGQTIELRIPATMSDAEAARYSDDLVPKLLRQAKSTTIDLMSRAGKLAHEYGLPTPASVRWVTNQHARWGSCTIDDASIRLSDRLADYPPWVLDYVLIHEIAHLVEPNHSAAFHAIVERYPKAERAKGFLIAKGLEQ